MKLHAYLSKHSITLSEFAGRIGVSTEAVRRYSNGLRMPRPEHLQKIRTETHGAVTPNDFLPAQVKKSRAAA